VAPLRGGTAQGPVDRDSWSGASPYVLDGRVSWRSPG
jgi:hypothetical protein